MRAALAPLELEEALTRCAHDGRPMIVCAMSHSEQHAVEICTALLSVQPPELRLADFGGIGGGHAPLLCALHWELPTLAQALLKHGADPRLCDTTGADALMLACRHVPGAGGDGDGAALRGPGDDAAPVGDLAAALASEAPQRLEPDQEPASEFAVRLERDDWRDHQVHSPAAAPSQGAARDITKKAGRRRSMLEAAARAKQGLGERLRQSHGQARCRTRRAAARRAAVADDRGGGRQDPHRRRGGGARRRAGGVGGESLVGLRDVGRPPARGAGGGAIAEGARGPRTVAPPRRLPARAHAPHWAAYYGTADLVRLLALACLDDEAEGGLGRDALNLNAKDKKQRTPLHLACLQGRIETAMQLLGLGASVDAQDVRGRRPIDYIEHADDVKRLRQQYRVSQIMNPKMRGWCLARLLLDAKRQADDAVRAPHGTRSRTISADSALAPRASILTAEMPRRTDARAAADGDGGGAAADVRAPPPPPLPSLGRRAHQAAGVCGERLRRPR